MIGRFGIGGIATGLARWQIGGRIEVTYSVTASPDALSGSSYQAFFGSRRQLGIGTSGAVAVVERHAPSRVTSANDTARPVLGTSLPARSAATAAEPANSAVAAAQPPPSSRAPERSAPVEARGNGRTANATVAAAASNPGAPGVVSTLSEEATLLERAQRALAAREPGVALETLAEHERRFPRGALAEEREAAKVLALCALGRVNEARALARAFVNASPRSVLVPRVEHSCAAPY